LRPKAVCIQITKATPAVEIKAFPKVNETATVRVEVKMERHPVDGFLVAVAIILAIISLILLFLLVLIISPRFRIALR
jgi:hypothetical protein